jgi:hypothetical protein
MADDTRPPVDMECLRRQLAAITEYLKAHVWRKG